MSSDLVKKKRIRGTHKASTTKIMHQISKLVSSDTPDLAMLACMRQALNEKLTTIKALDTEVIELTEDDAIVEDIEQADGFKETVFSSLLSVDKLMESSRYRILWELSPDPTQIIVV